MNKSRELSMAELAHNDACLDNHDADHCIAMILAKQIDRQREAQVSPEAILNQVKIAVSMHGANQLRKINDLLIESKILFSAFSECICKNYPNKLCMQYHHHMENAGKEGTFSKDTFEKYN